MNQELSTYIHICGDADTGKSMRVYSNSLVPHTDSKAGMGMGAFQDINTPQQADQSPMRLDQTYREEDILFVLVDSAGVRTSICVFHD